MTTILNVYNKTFYQVYRLFAEYYIQLVYHGMITSEKSDALINVFEQLLGGQEAGIKIKKRAFYILVEAIQNVVRHQVNPDPFLKESGGTLSFQYAGGKFMFTLKNLIETSRTKNIKKRIDSLNEMDKQKLNKYYKKILKNELLSEKGGAGLGLIEIARKSENILHYDFRKANDNCSYFYLNMLVAGDDKITDPFLEKGLPVTREIHRLLLNTGGAWFILREEHRSNLSTNLRSSISTLVEQNKNKKFSKFLSLLKYFPRLCNLSSGIPEPSGKTPCLFYFIREQKHISIYSGMVVPSTSPINFTAFSTLFSNKINRSAVPANIMEFEKDKDLIIRDLPGLLSYPPRIIIQDISPAEKFVLIKFVI